MRPLLRSALLLIGLALGAALSGPASAAKLFRQVVAAPGGLAPSGQWGVDGSDWDQQVWDNFRLTKDAQITSVHWWGGFGTWGSATTVDSFRLEFWTSIDYPDGRPVQPDVGNYQGGMVRSYRFAIGKVTQTVEGERIHYQVKLPQPLLLKGATNYWLSVLAWQSGVPSWGWAWSDVGDNLDFYCTAWTGDKFYLHGSQDMAYQLVGR